ncbi:hypothetical protein ABWL39_11200 [Chitinivorax sp. PXF-14]|uniref:hypothetical protein n=1 Tax=Chitinivorax sp. PXF-14 TaxID=3230488 RepID=UPI0034667FA9
MDATPGRFINEFPQHGLVSEMDAIEVANGQRTRRAIRHKRRANYLHEIREYSKPDEGLELALGCGKLRPASRPQK